MHSTIPLHQLPLLTEDLLKGYLALESGLLGNIRFEGNYGVEWLEYRCHYQLKGEQRHKDCPHDYTTTILQHIFPSPGHTGLAVNNAKSDFFNNLSIPNIKKIIDTYESDEDFKITQLHGFNATIKNRIASSSPEGAEVESKIKFRNIENNYDLIFEGSKKEQQIYPNIVKLSLLALAIKKAKKIEDLVVFYSDKLRDSSHDQEVYYEDFYNQFTQKNLLFFSKDLENILSHNPGLFSYFLLSYLNKNSEYPRLIGSTTQAHYNKTLFTACGETSLRNFLNIVTNDQSTATFNEQHLVGPSEQVDNFYKKYNSHKAIQNDAANNEWAEIISALPGLRYYNKDCELETDIDNMLVLIGTLFNDDSLKEKISSKEIRALRVKEMLKKFSRPGFELTTNKDQLFYSDNFDVIINGKLTFNWMFYNAFGGHAALSYVKDDNVENKKLDFILDLATDIDNEYKVFFATIFNGLNGFYRIDELVEMAPYLIHKKSPAGDTLLHQACTKNHLNLVKSLVKLANKEYISQRDSSYNENSALHIAVSNRNIEIIKLLLDAGADLNQSNRNFQTPMSMARQMNDNDFIQAIKEAQLSAYIKRGVNEIIGDFMYSGTALHMAVQREDTQTIEQLIAAGADINIKDTHNKTALDQLDKISDKELRNTIKSIILKNSKIETIQDYACNNKNNTTTLLEDIKIEFIEDSTGDSLLNKLNTTAASPEAMEREIINEDPTENMSKWWNIAGFLKNFFKNR